MDARAEVESIVRDAWAIYEESGDERDAVLAREMEAEMCALLALLPAPRPRVKKSSKHRKRNAFKHCVRLDANAPILTQVRPLVR